MSWQERPRWLRWGVEIALIVVVILAVSAWQKRDHLRGNAPVTELNSIVNTPVVLQQADGSPVLVHFSASWCPICQMMQSSILELRQSYPVITILVQMSDQEVTDWLAEHPSLLPEQVVRDDSGQLLRQFGGKALPMDVVITAKGEIATSEQGLSSSWGLKVRLWLAN
jgi:thiol-disulfide isomerase/thioredoxin